MDESSFRRLFRAAVGEAPVPPDLRFTAARALGRPATHRFSPWLTGLGAAAALLVVAAVAGYALLAHAGPGGTAPAGPGPATSPTATPTPAPSPTPAGPVACAAGTLSASLAGSQGAAGHRFLAVRLANTGTSACTVDGYPSAQLVSGSGAPLSTRVVDGGGMLSNGAPPAPFTLAPGQAATFQLSWGDVPVNGESCPTAAAAQVGPPGSNPSPALQVPIGAEVCNSGEVDVSAVAPA